jgi:multidrug efflux pump subunit AcrB
MNALIKAAVGRPVSTVMAAIAVVIVGLLASASLGLSELPDVRLPKLVVSTTYSGLPAQEVRALLTVPLEDVLASVRGLRHVESLSREGTSTITVEFQWGTDLRVAGVELREALDSARSVLPADARKPLVLPVDPADEPLTVVAVVPKAGDLTLAKRLAAKELKTRLQQVRGVGAVVTVGGLDEEILLEVDRNRLASRSLTLSELAQVLAASNYDYPAGTLTEGPSELVVKAQGKVSEPAALADLRVNTFPVSDVATIRSSNADPKSAFSWGGTPAVGLFVHRQPGASPVETADALHAEVGRLSQDYGRDLEVSVAFDGTTAVRQGLATLAFDALAGVLIAFIVVFVFVRDGATSLIVVLTVPVAVLVTLSTLKLFGRTLNLFSIGGLALSIGMMVDHTVVVLENLHRAAGRTKTGQAVAEATAALSLSNIGATGTAVIVFLPVVFLPGVVGSLFADLSLAVMTAHLASFLLSVTLVPVLFLLLPTRHREPAFMAPLENRYRGLLSAAFRRPSRVGWAVAAVLLAGVALSPLLKFEVFPLSDDGVVDVRFLLPKGTGIPSAGAIARDVEARLAAAGFSRAYSRVGGDDEDAYFHADPNESQELLHTRVLVPVGTAREAVVRVRAVFQTGDDIEVGLPPSPMLRLLGAAEDSFLVTGSQPSEARERLAEIRSRWTTGVRAFPEGRRPEIHFEPDRPMIAQTGTDLTAVAEALRDGIDGVVPTKVTVAGRDIDVRVRMRLADRDSLDEIRQFPVKGKDNKLLNVGDLGRLAETDADAAFYRYDRRDAVIVTAPRPWPLEHRADVRVPSDEAARDQTLSFVLTFALVIVLLYLFLGAQLGSFGLPLALLAAIPLSFAGVVTALVAGGVSVNVASMLGVVALFGVVINNSILLYQVFRGGTGSRESLVVGSVTRLRPILMTAAITVLSLAPLSVNAGASAEGGMALALIGGLAVSTALTLVVVPLLFSRRKP